MFRISASSIDDIINELFASPRPQHFSFPPDVISRLWKTPVSANGLLKLYQTCKYFFSKQRILVFTQKTKDVTYGEEYISFKEKGLNAILIKKRLHWFDADFSISKFSVSHKITNIYRCTIKKLNIQSCYLCVTEFDILISENTIKDFTMIYSEIGSHHGPGLLINEILQKLPNVTKILYKKHFEKFSFQSLQKLNNNVKFWNKLENFQLLIANPNTTFDENLLFQFLEKNASIATKFQILLSEHIIDVMETRLNNAFNKEFEKWETKPSLIISVSENQPNTIFA